MTDWTTCRVVRDRAGYLWFRGCDSDDLWTANTNYPDVFLTTDEVLTVFGPLAPVLDADGLPVVHTVGDLTADGDGDWEVIESRLAEVPALLAERDALAAKLDAVRALHRREVRWGNEDYSIDAEEYADRKTENDEVDAGWGLDALAAFDVCAECYRVEQSIEQRDGVAVLEGLWPCPTARALDAETGGES